MFILKKLSLPFFSAALLALAGCASFTPLNEVTLFDGTDLSQWRTPTGKWMVVHSVSLNKENPHLFNITPGTGVLINGPDGKTSHLRSTFEHGDCHAHVEFLVSSNSNSGVYLQGRYEVQILDSWGVEHPKYGDCGGIYQRWKNNAGYEGHAPRVNACKPPGEWQTFDIVFRAPRFDAAGKKTQNAQFIKVYLNGKLIHENVEVSGPTRSPISEKEEPVGPLVLQGDHGPVAFRNIWIDPVENYKGSFTFAY